MRIALIAEGCYPYVTGGVSTWCDQLVRGLPDHEFEVVAITATTRVQPAMPLPDNVVAVRPVALWDWAPRHRRVGEAARVRFLDAYRRLLATCLPEKAAQADFDAALRDLFEVAQDGDLSRMFDTDEVVSSLVAAWEGAYPEVALSLRDALDATELMEHLLLPLGAPVPRADVVHPVSNGLPALLALAAKWRHGTPILMSEHGIYLRERYLGFQSVHYSWPVKAILLAFLRRLCWTAYAQTDLIAPVNVFNRRWEVRHGADPDRVHTVYNGVDPALFVPQDEEPTGPVVGWVGRIDPLKDLHTLVSAFALVRQRVPAATLRLFGPVPAGNEEYAASVRALVDELGLGDAVTFEGPVRPVSTAYHASSVVVLSSISEGLPYTVMEAMMCGRATVSSDVGGVVEVAGDAGLVVPPRDPAALAEALADLLEDDARRRDLGRRARARALDLFQLDTMVGTFRDLYRRLAVQAPAGPGADTLVEPVSDSAAHVAVQRFSRLPQRAARFASRSAS